VREGDRVVDDFDGFSGRVKEDEGFDGRARSMGR
jgi:hypothetical protein